MWKWYNRFLPKKSRNLRQSTWLLSAVIVGLGVGTWAGVQNLTAQWHRWGQWDFTSYHCNPDLLFCGYDAHHDSGEAKNFENSSVGPLLKKCQSNSDKPNRISYMHLQSTVRGGSFKSWELTLTDAKGGQWAVGSHLIPHSNNATDQCKPLVQPTNQCKPRVQPTGVPTNGH